ncbi:hypothetical protein OUZ56_017027 [Daphnia magna]|uniref:Uncharacterized protein n=1 Tax=Daphnia magna TaxID=35525 RepID=A0ABR0ARZ3_9CRUS|nr:hypothetical protein OUZ56_017027 [Daphnia magna]
MDRFPRTMSSRPKRKCKGTNLPHLRVSKTPSPSKVMDPVTNDSLSVTQEEDSSMSPQPLIVDKSQEWKIRAEVLAEEDSSLKDKVKLLEEALLAQKVASDELFFLLKKYLHFQKITSLESERERLANILSVVEAIRFQKIASRNQSRSIMERNRK